MRITNEIRKYKQYLPSMNYMSDSITKKLMDKILKENPEATPNQIRDLYAKAQEEIINGISDNYPDDGGA